MDIPPGPVCQSCAMPMQKNEDYGSEKDGSQSDEYCCYCYQSGQFVDPGISLEEMIDCCSWKMDEIDVMPYDEARKLNERIMPSLKRWSG
jgi:hypothetical protein